MSTNILNKTTQLHYQLPSIASIKKKHTCMFVHNYIDGKLSENFAEYFSLLSHQKGTSINSISLNLPSVRTVFSKRSVYLSSAKLYNELPVQIQQLTLLKIFKKSIDILFDWERRHGIISFLIFRNIGLKILRRSKMLLNLSMEILNKSLFRWFGSLSTHLSLYRLLCVRLLLLLRFFLDKLDWRGISVLGIFLVRHIFVVIHYWS